MKKEKKTATISTLLGADTKIEGIIEFEKTIRLDGKVNGKIISKNGTVIVGEKAVIDAEMIVDVAIIKGHVNGSIDAKSKIEVYPPGKIIGDIKAPLISIDSGVVFDGRCQMAEHSNISDKNSKSLQSKKESVNEVPVGKKN